MAILVQSNKKPSVSFPSQTGSIVTFNSQYAGLPLKSHVVDVDYTGSAIGGVNIQNTCGINQWDELVRNGYYDANNHGVFVAHNNMIANITPIKVMPSKTYYVKSSTYQLILSYYDAGMNFISQTGAIRNTTFTPPSNCAYVNLSNSWNAGATYNNDISINYPSTDTSYHAFEGQSFNITFPAPIYGGQYDCLTGIVTSDKDSGGGDITPTYQQTATANCLTLLGENNIWADTGETTASYIKIGG